MLVLEIVLVIIILLVLARYNTLIRMRNKVKQAKSGIDVYLNQRFDLIPNLVECVKGYANYEKSVLENITEMRAKYLQGNKKLKDAEKLNNSLNGVLAVAENYPELKANEQFLNLQKNLVKMESQLQAARRLYNNEVTEYNTVVESLPTNIVALLFGFRKQDLFEIEEYKRNNINVGEQI